MSRTFFYNEEHKYIKREGTPGNYTYIYKQPEKGSKWMESNKWLKSLKEAVEKGKKEVFKSLVKDREDKMKGLTGDNKAQDQFIDIVRQGIKQFGIV